MQREKVGAVAHHTRTWACNKNSY